MLIRVLCTGMILWVWDGMATLSLDGRAGGASSGRLHRWLCRDTWLCSECPLRGGVCLIIVSEGGGSTLLPAASRCRSYLCESW